MALTLKEAITATQTTLDVSGADAILADYIYSIGDEYILVRNMPEVATLKFGEAAYQRLTVLRGIQGTTKAAHDADAALTQVTPSVGGGGVTIDNQSDPPASVTTLVAPGATISGSEADLSGVLRVRQLGPFRITSATAGTVGGGVAADNFGGGAPVEVAPIPDGAIIIQAWPEIVTMPAEPGGATIKRITIGIAPTGDPDAYGVMTPSWFIGPSDQGAFFGTSRDYNDIDSVWRSVQDCSLVAVLVSDAWQWTGGEFDIYVLIAVPA
jgi:hypothetical protein